MEILLFLILTWVIVELQGSAKFYLSDGNDVLDLLTMVHISVSLWRAHIKPWVGKNWCLRALQQQRSAQFSPALCSLPAFPQCAAQRRACCIQAYACIESICRGAAQRTSSRTYCYSPVHRPWGHRRLCSMHAWGHRYTTERKLYDVAALTGSRTSTSSYAGTHI
jgi:hypothetical protein